MAEPAPPGPPVADPDAPPAPPTAAQLLTQFNTYFENVLLISDQGVRDALNGQGLVSISDFEGLTEEDIAEICNNARKPGGTIPNPAYDAAAPVAGVPQTITNPGVLVGHVIEKRLKMVRYYVHHLKKISRDFDPGANHANLQGLQDLYRFKTSEDEYDNDIEVPERLTAVENIRVVLEDLNDYLERKRGCTGIPLAAYTRTMQTIPPTNMDAGYGRPSISAELIRRAPHSGPTALTDNEAVWDAICHVTHDGPGWGWVQAFSRTRNGRQAYLALKTHYFGDAYQTRLRAKADQALETNYYDGTKRHYTYEKYIESLQRAFTDLESTGEFVSNERKVRVLMTGIHDPRLESAKNTILATPELRASFETASNYMAEVLDNKVSYSATTRKARISAVQTNNRKNNGGTPNNKNKKKTIHDNEAFNPNRYFPLRQWIKLSKEQQEMVRSVRDAQNSSTKKRTASAIRSGRKKQKTENGSTTTTEDSLSSDGENEEKEAGIGAIMSQRKKGKNKV